MLSGVVYYDRSRERRLNQFVPQRVRLIAGEPGGFHIAFRAAVFNLYVGKQFFYKGGV